MKNAGFLTLVILFLILCVIQGLICWPYTINTWLEFVGKEPVIVWWQGALIGICPVIGQMTFPAAVVTFILMLFL